MRKGKEARQGKELLEKQRNLKKKKREKNLIYYGAVLVHSA